jgi:hypothetical protein
MNPMKEAWKMMKGDEEFRIEPRHMSAQDKREFQMRGYNPDDFPTSVPRPIQQGRPVNVHRTESYPIQQGWGVRYGGNNPVARLEGQEGEEMEGLQPGTGLDAQGVVRNRGRYKNDNNKGRYSNFPTTAKIGEDSGEGRSGARVSTEGGYIEDIGQQVQAMPRPTPGQVDDLSRQEEGGVRAQTSGFQSKPYGRLRNRQPKMGPGGVPKGMGAFDQPRPELMQSLRQRGIIGEDQYKGYPMIESWGALLKRSMCKGDDCKGCRGCKCCPKCEPQGSTCEKMGCA